MWLEYKLGILVFIWYCGWGLWHPSLSGIVGDGLWQRLILNLIRLYFYNLRASENHSLFNKKLHSIIKITKHFSINEDLEFTTVLLGFIVLLYRNKAYNYPFGVVNIFFHIIGLICFDPTVNHLRHRCSVLRSHQDVVTLTQWTNQNEYVKYNMNPFSVS